MFNVSLYHPRVQSKIKPLKLEVDQLESQHLYQTNWNQESNLCFQHNKLENQLGQNHSFDQFDKISRLFQGQTLQGQPSFQRSSSFALHHIPTHSRDNDTSRFLTIGSSSSASSFESQDESHDRPSVIVKLIK